MVDLYDVNGFIDFNNIEYLSSVFNFLVGGRGTGKSYGALLKAYNHYKHTGQKFIYLRAMKSQIESVSSSVFSPFKPINDDLGINITVDTAIKGIQGFYDTTEDSKELIGLCCSLSSFASLRGFDASDFSTIIWDEFIPKDNEVVRGNWGRNLIDFYETVNRNRELKGGKPVKVYCLANSNKIGNQVFMEFDLLNKAIDMIRKKQSYAKLDDKNTALFFFQDSPISRKKADTALYKAINNDYKDMALSNIFSGVNNDKVRSLPINQLRPVIQCHELYIYEYQQGYYISNKGFLPMESVSYEVFKKLYYSVINSIIFERVLYENISAKIIAQEYTSNF